MKKTSTVASSCRKVGKSWISIFILTIEKENMIKIQKSFLFYRTLP
jgi:hypothetical protein